MQIFLVYYGLGQSEAVRESFLWPFFKEAYWCAIFTFTLNTSAYTAEILRAHRFGSGRFGGASGRCEGGAKERQALGEGNEGAEQRASLSQSAGVRA